MSRWVYNKSNFWKPKDTVETIPYQDTIKYHKIRGKIIMNNNNYKITLYNNSNIWIIFKIDQVKTFLKVAVYHQYDHLFKLSLTEILLEVETKYNQLTLASQVMVCTHLRIILMLHIKIFMEACNKWVILD